MRIAGIIVTQRCGNRMRARFFAFEGDMRFAIGLSDGNTVIFKGKVCRHVLWHGEVHRYSRHRMIRRIFHRRRQLHAVTVIRHHLLSRDIQRDLRVAGIGRNIDCLRIVVAVRQCGFGCMNTQNRALKGNFSNTVLISITRVQTQLRVCGGGAEDY